ncbi:hypothetical protein [Qipengyuania sp. ASV99]|uniref:hypothetical protein n=1 Tax=Qipengyuania sp. ASV99 TaxID=3399681 RepID=UPI003A4C72FB
MSSRISSFAAITCALTACGSGESPAPEGAAVDCAIGPGSEYAEVCTLERVSAELFVIHHPDGGFRRFRIGSDPAARIAVADGAQPVVNETLNEAKGTLEFSLGVDRYRIRADLIANVPDE